MIDRTPSSFVRRALLADGIVSGVTGALLTLSAPFTSTLFGLPASLLTGAGIFCVAYGATLGWLSRAPSLSPPVVRTIIVGNALWVAASVGLMLLGPPTMTTLGTAFVGLQALVVAVLAELQWTGLRREPLVQLTSPAGSL